MMEDPQARAAAREMMKDPETRKKVWQEVKEIPAVERAIEAEKEEQREVQRKREKQGKWGHIETVYPEDYTGPRYEHDYSRRNPDKYDHEKPRRESEAPPRPKTVYPSGYKPPRHDEEPFDVAMRHH